MVLMKLLFGIFVNSGKNMKMVMVLMNCDVEDDEEE